MTSTDKSAAVHETLAHINGKPPTALSLLNALVDIYDDMQHGEPEERQYVKSAWPDILEQARSFLAAPASAQEAPIDMVLHCPKCGLQHVDAPEDADCDGEVAHSQGWSNPPHRSHLCHGCGHVWRPADVPTNGVQAVKTAGKADSPIAAPSAAVQQGEALTDEQLGAIAYKGFDDYWAEDGNDSEAWEASAKAVRAALASAQPKTGEA